MELIRRFVVEEEGADATEYALVVGLVALGIAVGAGVLGGGLSDALKGISNRVGTCANIQLPNNAANGC